VKQRDDDWQEWGPVFDREATIGVIQALQSDGKQVRVVREGNRNVIYVKPRHEAKP
jgi:hypothetical protein